ncbi:hypothetical protein [Methylobacterium sp. sgz302541]|uniref:hypothetical protein n=1 Tax=unclassified Methylobacterium TaxID=2615210 RepID=UPI003D329CB3
MRRTRIARRGALILAGLLAAAPAAAIEGRYAVEGSNPGRSDVTYRGLAAIRKSGDTYSIVWQIGSGRQIGTGILTGSVLSVVFRSIDGKGGGVASFETADGAVTSGRWAVTGGTATGTERWTVQPNP